MRATVLSPASKFHVPVVLAAALAVVSVGLGCAAPPAEQPQSPAEDTTAETPAGLADTSWQLVQITSMDDTVYTPDDPLKYTLTFNADGTATIVADCNRGHGSWTSASEGKLEFGPIAATQALCLPGSISETYLAQFQWVRGYVMKNGHLFLATMADGSIIEFEPRVLPVVATVLGEEIRAADARELQAAILTPLLDRYAAEHDIELDDSDIDAFVETMERGMAEDPNLTAETELTPEEAAEATAMRREMARSIVRQWKVNRALYQQYDGRIIYQQLGPEPLDAYRQFLEERQAAGDFTIRDPGLADEFWRYFTDDAMHDFMEPGSDDAAQAFSVPPWERSAD